MTKRIPLKDKLHGWGCETHKKSVLRVLLHGPEPLSTPVIGARAGITSERAYHALKRLRNQGIVQSGERVVPWPHEWKLT